MSSSQLNHLSQWMIDHHTEVIESGRDSSSSEDEEILVTPQSSRLRSLSCDPFVSWMKTYERGVEWSDTEKWDNSKGKEREVDPVYLDALEEPVVEYDLVLGDPSTSTRSVPSFARRVGSHISLRSHRQGRREHRIEKDAESFGCLSFFFDCPKRRFSGEAKARKVNQVRSLLRALENKSESFAGSESYDADVQIRCSEIWCFLTLGIVRTWPILPLSSSTIYAKRTPRRGGSGREVWTD